MADNKNKGFVRIINAAGYSWQGLRATFHHEEAFRQELWLCIVLLPLAIYLGQNGVEQALLIAPCLLLLLVEVLNSAIEAVVDRFGGEIHELSGRAKDMGSAAVFIALVLLVVIWALILWPQISLLF